MTDATYFPTIPVASVKKIYTANPSVEGSAPAVRAARFYATAGCSLQRSGVPLPSRSDTFFFSGDQKTFRYNCNRKLQFSKKKHIFAPTFDKNDEINVAKVRSNKDRFGSSVG